MADLARAADAASKSLPKPQSKPVLQWLPQAFLHVWSYYHGQARITKYNDGELAEEYERVLSPLRDKPIRFLELGVQGGWSMLMWKEFLPNATIVGVDMAEMPENFPQDERFHFIRSDQADPDLAAKALKAAGGFFDVIVDDASHLGFLTANSFRHLFPILAPGGTYIIEDIATCFTGCGEFDDAKFPVTHIGVDRKEKIFSSHQHGIIGFVKQLADYTQETVALKTNDWNQWPIYRVSLLPNMAVIDKCGSHLVSPNGCLHP